MSKKKGFIENLGRIYGFYTLGFLGFVVIMAVLEQLGVPNKVIGYLFIAMTIGIYAVIGVLARTAQVSQYYVAGREVPPVFNGMSTAADWMSGASFVGMAGLLYTRGYDGLAFVVGWTGGYVLVAVLLAPYLRKFGAYTVPDFLGSRYGGNTARLIGILVLFCCSFTYVTAQAYATGIITSRFLGIPFEWAVFFGLTGILVCSMFGGMRGVTWTQVAQYIVLIIAYMLPVVILSYKVTGVPVPQLMYGGVLEKITALEISAGFDKLTTAPFNYYDSANKLNFFGLIACLMMGTAALPHILMRFFTTPSVKAARLSVGWAMLFIFLLYFTAPAYATFAKYEIYTNVIGSQITALPDWVSLWSNVGNLLTITDLNGNGILEHGEFVIKGDIVVLATPEIAGLPYVIAGLVAAGGLAAALSTADGLLLAIANAFSHDVYYRMVNPKATPRKRLIVSRALLVIIAFFAAWLASTKPSDILSMVAWAFSIAASGLFPALVLGIWWKRVNTPGAISGMLVGFGVCMWYLVGTRYGILFPWLFGEGGLELWFGVQNISAGLFGIPAGLVTMVVVSLLTKAPSMEMQRFIDELRIPRGKILAKNQ